MGKYRKIGKSVLFLSATSTCTRTFVNLFAICIWDDYCVFFIAARVIAMLLLNDIYSPLWISIWLNVDCIEVVDLVLQLSAVISCSHVMIWTHIALLLQANRLTKCASYQQKFVSLSMIFFGFSIFCVFFYLDNVLIYVFHSYDALNSKK